MSLHASLLEMKKLLGNLDGWLTKAAAYAEAKKFDPAVLLQSRLAVDMFPLARQVQSACDQAKFAAARTTGKQPPAHPDTEQTIDDLKKRIATVSAYLDEFTADDFTGAGERRVSLPWWEGKSMSAAEYFTEFVQPNFFFHLSMAYAILRHAGVDVGKRDYIGALPLK
jgi:hypothetical protein